MPKFEEEQLTTETEVITTKTTTTEEMKTTSFADLDISPEFLNAINDMGFEEPTNIQIESVRIMHSGKDVIGQSQTGTGKTAAFGIPCLERIDENDRSLQCLVLCPTRELAIQISEEFRRLLKYRPGIKILPVYGGQPIDRQIFALKKGIQVVIGTPGRVMDHMRRRTLKVDTVRTIVLDEADEMLDMGFREDIETVLKEMPETRQTMLYSATLSPAILALAKKYTNNPEMIKITPKELTVPRIEQIYFDIKEHAKLEALCRIIDMDRPDLSIVFCNTKRRVDDVTEQLQGRGYFAEGLHGDLKQSQRDRVMQGFRKGNTEILVATDVAARGIDVDDIDIVVNYDMPQDEEYYVHRIGRTGRAGRTGKAYTFIVGKEIYRLRDIMRYTHSKILQSQLPSLSDIEEIRTVEFIDKIKKIADDEDLTRYINMVETIVNDDYSAMDIAAAMMKIQMDELTVKGQEIDFTPSRGRDNSRGNNRSGNDRGFNRDRKERSGSRPRNREGMTRLFVSAGRDVHIEPRDIVGAIAGESHIPGGQIGAIEIHDSYTYVDVPEESSAHVVSVMNGNTIKGHKVSVEVSQSSGKVVPIRRKNQPRRK